MKTKKDEKMSITILQKSVAIVVGLCTICGLIYGYGELRGKEKTSKFFIDTTQDEKIKEDRSDIERLDLKIDRVDEKLDKFNDKIDRNNENMNKRFDNLFSAIRIASTEKTASAREFLLEQKRQEKKLAKPKLGSKKRARIITKKALKGALDYDQ